MSQKTISLSSSRYCLIILLLFIATPVFADSNTEGHWRFTQTAGPIIDSHNHPYTQDLTNNRPNNGFVGTWADAWEVNENPLLRNGARITLSGQSQDHVVMIPDEVYGDFNAGMDTFIWKVKLKLIASDLDNGKMPSDANWNVMQKGRWGKNGMWKMQILPFNPTSNRFFTTEQQTTIANTDWAEQATAGDPVVMCVVQDENNTFFAMSQVRLKSGTIYYPRCVIDRTYGWLKAIVRYNNGNGDIRPPGEQSGDMVNRRDISGSEDREPGSNALGAVNPGQNDSLNCRAGEPLGFGGHDILTLVAIGNKPYCPNHTQVRIDVINDPNSTTEQVDKAQSQLNALESDAFKGKIYQVKVEKPTTF